MSDPGAHDSARASALEPAGGGALAPPRQGDARGKGSWIEAVRRAASSEKHVTLFSLALLLAAMLAWAASLLSVHLSSLGGLGLAPALPLAWWASLLVLVAGACVLCTISQSRGWLIAAYIAAIVVVLYATLPALSGLPQYSWTYKHVGVTRLIGQLGTVMPDPDIYNRWPGLFSVAAAFSKVTGVDALSYAAWFEFAFSLVNAALVGAIAWAIVRDRRIAGMAVLLFVLTNWVGQSYFSPQALAFTLDLALVLIVIRQFSSTPGVTRATVLAEWVSGRFQRPMPLAAKLRWPADPAIAAVLVLGAVITATHQFTPYVVVLQVGLLTWLGFVRPRLLWVALTAIAIAYLIPNFGYVNSNFDLLSALAHPFSNFFSSPEGPALYRPFLVSAAPKILTFALGIGGAFGLWRMLRAGRGYQAIPLAALAVAPFALAFAQSYGGEATLRVFLFSAPFLCILAALGLGTLSGPNRRALLVASGTVAAVLFVYAFFGNAATNLFAPGEVRASAFYYAHAPDNSTLELANQAFPARVGARYTDVAENYLPPATLGLGSSGVPAVIQWMRNDASTAFVAFSSTQDRYAQLFRTAPPGALPSLEAAIARSPLFRLWYANRDARIYELTPSVPPVPSAGPTQAPQPSPAQPSPAQPPPPQPLPAPVAPPIPGLVRIGDSGAGVAQVQRAVGATADGRFGPATSAAVASFQRSHGLTPDGVVGPLTQRALSNQPPAGVSPPPPAARRR